MESFWDNLIYLALYVHHNSYSHDYQYRLRNQKVVSKMCIVFLDHCMLPPVNVLEIFNPPRALHGYNHQNSPGVSLF